jgi:hypothetical protein
MSCACIAVIAAFFAALNPARRRRVKREKREQREAEAKAKAKAKAAYFGTNADEEIEKNPKTPEEREEELLKDCRFKTLKSSGVLTIYEYVGTREYPKYRELLTIPYKDCLEYIKANTHKTPKLMNISSKEQFWNYIVANPRAVQLLHELV